MVKDSSKPAVPSERINPSGTERDRTRNTPSADMQAEDAGTAASGNDEDAARNEPAKKQSPTGSNSSN